jgi:hypothetical protein
VDTAVGAAEGVGEGRPVDVATTGTGAEAHALSKHKSSVSIKRCAARRISSPTPCGGLDQARWALPSPCHRPVGADYTIEVTARQRACQPVHTLASRWSRRCTVRTSCLKDQMAHRPGAPQCAPRPPSSGPVGRPACAATSASSTATTPLALLFACRKRVGEVAASSGGRRRDHAVMTTRSA